jgi:hypothetical protein
MSRRRIVRRATPRGWRQIAALAAATCGVTAATRDVRADVTSWMAVGAGYAMERNRVLGENEFAAAMTYSLGVGSTPLDKFVLGGLVRGTTFVGLGTDLGLALRVCTGGFARGDWGAALEAGALWRPWLDGAYGAWPAQGVLTVGAPWGFQVALGTELFSLTNEHAALGGFATLEIDLLRLTVMRQGGTEKWWYNPAPAGGHQAIAFGGSGN